MFELAQCSNPMRIVVEKQHIALKSPPCASARATGARKGLNGVTSNPFNRQVIRQPQPKAHH